MEHYRSDRAKCWIRHDISSVHSRLQMVCNESVGTMRWFILATLLATTSLFAQRALVPGDTESFLDNGIDAYRSGDFQKAIEAFQIAIEFDPNDVRAHLYLATANMVLYSPGQMSKENLAHAENARAEFKRVLELSPDNTTAMLSLGTLSLREAGDTDHPDIAKLDDAHSWYQKVLEVDAQNKNALYTIGVIDWRKAHPNLAQADATQRRSLKAQYGPIVDEGISSLKKALNVDPVFESAMSYLNLLLRDRAQLAESPDESQKDLEEASQWVQKLGEMRTLRSQTAGRTPGRFSGNLEAAQLITKVDPVYPPQARQEKIQGTVRFRATIAKDGKLHNVQLVSGHPLLVPAALDAIKKWTYRPSMANGQAVEVVTNVDVNFSLSQ